MLINIDVPDMEAGIAFYGRVVGLRVGRRFDEDFVELLGAGIPVFLIRKDGGTSIGPEGGNVRSYSRHWTPIHPDFGVDDLDSAIERATEAGAVQEGATEQFPYGRQAMFADPFGHGFCLIEFNELGYDGYFA